MNILPNEILFHIVDYLDVRDVVYLGSCNKEYRSFYNSEDMWKHLSNKKFRRNKLCEQTARSRFISRYKFINWWVDDQSINLQIQNIMTLFSYYQCEPPPETEMIYGLITIMDGRLFDYNPDVLQIAKSYQRSFLQQINFTTVLFFTVNFPNLFRPYLLKRFEIWGGNDLIGLTLYSMKNNNTRKIAIALIETFPDEVLRHLTEPSFVLQTFDHEESYHTSGFRRLVGEGAYNALELVIQRYGTSPFIPEVLRIDDINYGIIADITGPAENRGVKDVKTLELLYKYFSTELHQVVSNHILLTDHPNSIFALSQTHNIPFIRTFMGFFRSEVRRFIEHVENLGLHLRNNNYDFQNVYAFAKASMSIN